MKRYVLFTQNGQLFFIPAPREPEPDSGKKEQRGDIERVIRRLRFLSGMQKIKERTVFDPLGQKCADKRGKSARIARDRNPALNTDKRERVERFARNLMLFQKMPEFLILGRFAEKDRLANRSIRADIRTDGQRSDNFDPEPLGPLGRRKIRLNLEGTQKNRTIAVKNDEIHLVAAFLNQQDRLGGIILFGERKLAKRRTPQFELRRVARRRRANISDMPQRDTGHRNGNDLLNIKIRDIRKRQVIKRMPLQIGGGIAQRLILDHVGQFIADRTGEHHVQDFHLAAFERHNHRRRSDPVFAQQLFQHRSDPRILLVTRKSSDRGR